MDTKEHKYQRANFMLRVPHELAEDIKTVAKREGLSVNYMATRFLRAGVRAMEGEGSITDRLARMGVL